MGGEFRFRSTVTDLMIRDRKLTAVIVNAKEEIPAEICILAPGHSARDTFAMLEKHNINMEPKSFAVGVRVEHPQTMINQDLYGEPENDRLGASSYKVTHTLENGRGVYSFCMCPGGYVVNASSEEGMLAVNGMSYQARDSHNANSAIIVTVNPSDFPEEGVLGGIALQRKLERAAWEAGKGKIPVQLFKDYCTHQKSTRLGDVIPCIKGAYTLTDVRSIFPKEIGDSIEAGIHAFGKKLSGFDRPGCIAGRSRKPYLFSCTDRSGTEKAHFQYRRNLPLRRGRRLRRRHYIRSDGRDQGGRSSRFCLCPACKQNVKKVEISGIECTSLLFYAKITSAILHPLLRERKGKSYERYYNGNARLSASVMKNVCGKENSP